VGKVPIGLEIAGVSDGFGLHPEMQKTGSTGFNKREIEREMSNLELTLNLQPSTTAPEV